MQLNQEYCISQCKIKAVNKAYKQISHDFELCVELYSIIKPVAYNDPRASNIVPPVKIWTLIEFAYEVKENPQCGVFHVEATIIEIDTKIEEVIYKGCPLEACKKKVVCTNDTDESYFCEKCNIKYPTYQNRFMLKIAIADFTGRLKVTLFAEAEKFLGISATDIAKLHETDYEKYKSYFKGLYKSYIFVLQGENKEFDGMNRVNGVCLHHYNIDYKESIRRLSKELKRLKTKRLNK